MERAIQFENQGEHLVGVLHRPDSTAADGRAVIFLGGWAGYRVGPHRIFVKLARSLSEHGQHSLRFDFRGRGDSAGDTEKANLGTMLADAERAVDWMTQEVSPTGFCLLGICSGALIAMGAASRGADRLVLWSPPSPREQDSGTRQRGRRLSLLKGYSAKLLEPATWRKMVALRIRPRTIGKVLLGEGAETQDDLATEALCLQRLRRFRGQVLFIFGTGDPEARWSAPFYRSLCEEHGLRHQVHFIEGSDHSFYSHPWEQEAITVTLRWLGEG